MSDKINNRYPDAVELHRKKETQRQQEARRPISEKMAAVVRLRDFERRLAGVRKANRAKRAAKQITIRIKTR